MVECENIQQAKHYWREKSQANAARRIQIARRLAELEGKV